MLSRKLHIKLFCLATEGPRLLGTERAPSANVLTAVPAELFVDRGTGKRRGPNLGRPLASRGTVTTAACTRREYEHHGELMNQERVETPDSPVWASIDGDNGIPGFHYFMTTCPVPTA